jgi:hypothetical protein
MLPAVRISLIASAEVIPSDQGSVVGADMSIDMLAIMSGGFVKNPRSFHS